MISQRRRRRYKRGVPLFLYYYTHDSKKGVGRFRQKRSPGGKLLLLSGRTNKLKLELQLAQKKRDPRFTQVPLENSVAPMGYSE